MNRERLKKLENLSKKILNDLIFEEIEDFENDFWIITITDTKISTDLSYLDVFVSSIKNEDLLTKTLAKHNFKIQSKYNKKINIRKLPRIRYRYDNKWEIWQNICETINQITK